MTDRTFNDAQSEKVSFCSRCGGTDPTCYICVHGARLETIEECAKIAETWFGNSIGKLSFGPSPQDAIAAAIRALAAQPPAAPVEKCPRPVIPDHSAKACVESGNCGCGHNGSSAGTGDVLDKIEQRLNESGTGEMGLLDTIHAVAALVREARRTTPNEPQPVSNELREALEPFLAVAKVMDFYVEEAMPPMTYPRPECESRYPDEPRCATLSPADFARLASCPLSRPVSLRDGGDK